MTPPGATTWAPSLTPEIMLMAYAQGIFPMSEGVDDPEVFWVDPRRRGILPLDGFHLSRSLAGTIRRGRLHATVDRAFADVVAGCADRPETWINAPIAEITLTLHERGQAHSVEVWDDETLVGGIYGVALGAAFFGESMFSRVRDASKVALATLVERLLAGGFVLLDTQFLTPHLASLGGIEVSRDRYRRMLAQALTLQANFAGPVLGPEAMLAALRGPSLIPSP